MAALERRLARMSPGESLRSHASTAEESSTKPAAAPDRRLATSFDSNRIDDLEARVSRLELAAEAVRREQDRFVDPDGIPARLAVLLASRGVMTKIGDIEAIIENATTLADLVRDPLRSDWDRLEAYRGLLMFPGDQQARETRRSLIELASASPDPKARRTAMGLLTNHMAPELAPALEALFYRESDTAVKKAIVQHLLRVGDDPVARRALQDLEPGLSDDTLRESVRAALGR